MGWRVLRFNTPQIRDELETEYLPTIAENINRLGGLEEEDIIPRRINLDAPDGLQQLTLFDQFE